MDESDADFDSYWEEEARNPNRNRIRIGRQYQATVPPLLKPGESDGRKLEELETLRWKPDNELSDQQLDQYLSVAKAVSLFARAIENNTSNHHNNESHGEESTTTETTAENNTSDDNNDKEKSNEEARKNYSTENLNSALKGLSEFVTSHHPGHHDDGCRLSVPDQLKSSTDNSTSSLIREWTLNETQLFTRALEMCGKNFSAIKKEFLPWKSVKSIIQHYYLGSDKELSKDHLIKINSLTNMPENFLPDLSDLASSSSTSSLIGAKSSKPQVKIENSTSSYEFKDLEAVYDGSDFNSANGQEVKPLKAKPILPSIIQETSGNTSTVGSLKFYMDGQLVLKLNAQQEQVGNKCQWVESQDTPKLPRPVKKKSKKLLIDKPEQTEAQGLFHNNHKCNFNDEVDDASVESSDDDSMESNESSVISSPSAVIAKKARVKVENNAVKPLSSPNSTSTKDQRNDSTSNCNRNIKIESTIFVKREISSPTNHLEDERKMKKSYSIDYNQSDKKNCSSLENKWYHTIIEKNSSNSSANYPPKAHSGFSMMQMNRQARTDSSSSGALAVDLTRKSTSCSPVDAKSISSSSSTSSLEKESKPKVMESPSPPRINHFHGQSQNLISPNYGQNKIKKETKSSNMCQKVDSRIKTSPPPSSSPSLVTSSPSQLTWLPNSFAPYLPIYEHYYRYYYTYGMPPQSISSEKSTSQSSLDSREDRSRCLPDSVFGNRPEGSFPKALVKPDNG